MVSRAHPRAAKQAEQTMQNPYVANAVSYLRYAS